MVLSVLFYVKLGYVCCADLQLHTRSTMHTILTFCDYDVAIAATCLDTPSYHTAATTSFIILFHSYCSQVFTKLSTVTVADTPVELPAEVIPATATAAVSAYPARDAFAGYIRSPIPERDGLSPNPEWENKPDEDWVNLLCASCEAGKQEVSFAVVIECCHRPTLVWDHIYLVTHLKRDSPDDAGASVLCNNCLTALHLS